MKTCSKCLIQLPFSSFNKRPKRPGQYQSTCKECNKEYQKQHYKNNKNKYLIKAKIHREKIKEKIRKIKESAPCKDCNKYYHYCQMDFDHISNKSNNISTMAGNDGRSWESIKKEISKCELVCSNCHRLRTFKRKL